MSHLPPLAHLPFSPAADRNKQPILDVLLTLLPPTGHALEVASGTGQHAVWFTAALPGWTWQPTEYATAALPWLRAAAAGRLLPPLQLDVAAPDWPLAGARFELIFCANLLHIAPRPCCAGLMQGARRHLAPQGLLITYGPYLEDAVPTAPSNLAFDADLKARNPSWGLRRLEDIQAEAQRAGLRLQQRVAMPANNLLLVWGLQG